MSVQTTENNAPMSGNPGVQRLEYLPRTFAQQGAVVPFTTRILSQARIRKGQRKRINGDRTIDVLLPGFAGGNSTYVTTLRSLGEVVTMSVHDRALTKLIADREAYRPVDIQRCWVDIALRGLGGAEGVARARQWQTDQAAIMHNDRVAMIEALAARMKITMPAAVLQQLRKSAEGEAALLAVIRDLPRDGQSDSRMIGLNMIDVSEVLNAVGLKQNPTPGVTRDLTWRLGELGNLLRDWGRETMSELGPTATACGDAATASFEQARQTLSRIDLRTADVAAILNEWPRAKMALQADLDRLIWLLDGWSYVVENWREVIDRKTTAEDAVTEILRVLPVLPPDEVSASADIASAAARVVAQRQSAHGGTGP